MSGLTEFQAAVTRLFFSLPASDGFLLAGGRALLASGLTSRPTQDLDFFGEHGKVDIAAARDQFENAVRELGWRCERVQNSASFVRAGHPPVVSVVGPTFDPEELAGRKLAALFSRAEARDFADVYVLAQHFDRSLLLVRAAEVDLGFNRHVLAEMARTIDRFSDDELPVDASDVAAVRAFFHRWADELERIEEE